MTTEATSFALTAGWTGATACVTSDHQNMGGSVGDFTGGTVTGTFPNLYGTGWPQWWGDYHYHYYTPYVQPILPLTVTEEVRVTLTFSEVDRLRKAAQKDAKLKAVLEKLTPCIEVVVDLG